MVPGLSYQSLMAADAVSVPDSSPSAVDSSLGKLQFSKVAYPSQTEVSLYPLFVYVPLRSQVRVSLLLLPVHSYPSVATLHAACTLRILYPSGRLLSVGLAVEHLSQGQSRNKAHSNSFFSFFIN